MATITFARVRAPLALKWEEKNFLTDNRFAYALTWDAGHIAFKCFTDPTALMQFDNGRIWGEKEDLQWHRKNDEWHLVLITENDEQIPEAFQQRHKLSKPIFEEKVFLWGEYDDSPGVKRWLEIKVPRFFDYSSFFADQANPTPPCVRMQVYAYEFHEMRRLWEMGNPIDLPVAKRVYRYGKVLGEGESL